MGDMKELIDERLVEQVILLLGVAGPVIGLVVGVLVGPRRGLTAAQGALRGLGLGLLGTLVWVLWRLYSYLVRYEPAPDPSQDYFGLERVDVLLLNVVIFVAVGAAVGWLIRWVGDRDAAARATTESRVEPVAGSGSAPDEAPAEGGG